jgi:hypothetical protein
MNYRRLSKKALKGYAGWKGFKGLTKVAAIAAAGWGAFRLYQNRKFA